MSIKNINIRLRSEIKIGLGLLNELQDELDSSSLYLGRMLVLYDKNLEDSDYFIKILSKLKEKNPGYFFQELSLKGEPSYELLEELLEKLPMGDFDSIISFGGGSLMDVGKGIALLSTNPEKPKNLKGFPTNLNNPLPHITVPSILGSGSEASFNAVFVDEEEGRKLGINSVNNFPYLVLVDPSLTLSAPISSVISSSLDSMVHCVDSFGSQKSNSFTRMFSIEGFRNIWHFLNNCDLKDPESRIYLAKSSIMGIYALMNSGDGPTNGFAYYFGVKDKIPHGLAGGMFLKDVMMWNYRSGYKDYADLLIDTNLNLDMFFDSFNDLHTKLNLPRLTEYGYLAQDCKKLSHEVSTALTGSFSGNPILFDQKSTKWVLDQQFKE